MNWSWSPGCHPIRAKKVRYFEDPEMKGASCRRPL